jgi:hypothetical protein
MRINDSSNKEQSLYHDFLFWTGAKNVSVDLTDFIRSSNFALDAVVRKIFQTSGRWQFDDANNSNLPIAITDLVAGQDNYTLADEHLRISRLRIKDKQGNWKTLRPIDRRDENDRQLARTGEPEVYDKLGRSVLPLPVPDYNAAGGVEITFDRGSNYFAITDTTKQPGIPSPFHRYISLYDARDYVLANEIPNKLQVIDTEIQRLDADLIQFIAYQDRDEKPSMSVKRTLEFY